MGTREGTEIPEKGELIMGKIVIGRGPISLVLVNIRISHIHGSPVNVGTVHVHGNMQTGVQIP